MDNTKGIRVRVLGWSGWPDPGGAFSKGSQGYKVQWVKAGFGVSGFGVFVVHFELGERLEA